MLLPQNGFLVVLWNRESSEKCSVHKWKQSGLCNWWGRCSIITSCKKLLLWFSVCFVSYWVKTSNLKYFEEFVRFASVSKSMCVCVCVGTKDLLIKYCKRNLCYWAECWRVSCSLRWGTCKHSAVPKLVLIRSFHSVWDGAGSAFKSARMC